MQDDEYLDNILRQQHSWDKGVFKFEKYYYLPKKMEELLSAESDKLDLALCQFGNEAKTMKLQFEIE